ncbi:GNAT family N-acetyltransferase [Paenibacillus motobuensis]|uniref:GNAT family N-acetyltransferase n=1 Tax=Paenibacillus TaxID=44249 RepID=UPI00203D140B|nr:MULTISPECIES: GNAT family N-acetyltransferase [Paenibacillus]MCM3039662.1 GNAT family N-acetyltransferase [Paenibacillus lutimineralis]MCM3646766.1 GNAT family N-acetyltransferase [Paenibacillus motobuensis]
MIIRQIEARDLTEIAKWEREISKISFGEEAIMDLSFHLHKLEKAMIRERPGMLVLDIDGYTAGWMWMGLRVNSVTQETYIQFRSFYISGPFRGTAGVDKLFEAGISFAKQKGVQKIVGHVHVHNLAMRTLYKKYGFMPTHLTMEYSQCGVAGEKEHD